MADDKSENELPKGIRGARAIRAVLNAAGGAIPFVGGVLSAGSEAWSEGRAGAARDDPG
jgi:hypothetical protein